MRSAGFSGEMNLLGSEENDIIKQYPGKPKGGQFQSLLFLLIQQPVRINRLGAPLLGLAKSIYYVDCEIISVRPANGQKPNGTSGPYYLVKPPFDPDFMLLRISLFFILSKVSAKRAQKENMSKTCLFESRTIFLAKG